MQEGEGRRHDTGLLTAEFLVDSFVEAVIGAALGRQDVVTVEQLREQLRLAFGRVTVDGMIQECCL